MPASRQPADERLASALLDEVRRRTGRDVGYAVAPHPLAGGRWAAILALRFSGAPPGLDGGLVLRILPTPTWAARELAIHAAVAEAGYPAPRLRMIGEASAGLGGAWGLMDRAPGGTLATGLAPRAWLTAFRAMPRLLAEATAHLHAIDPSPIADRLRASGGLESATLDAFVADVRATIERVGRGDLARALAWLESGRPAEGRRVVCHGDLQPLNLVVEGRGLAAVVDWTNARLAPPAFDVAYTAQILGQVPIALPRRFAAIGARLRAAFGRRARRRFLTELRSLAPVPDADELRWYDALHALRTLARVAQARDPRGLAPPLAADHPWEVVAAETAAALAATTGVAIELPSRRTTVEAPGFSPHGAR